MRVLGIEDYNTADYKLPAMEIKSTFCSGICALETGNPLDMCVNYGLRDAEIITIADEDLIERYISNADTKAIIFSGLEPLEQIDEIVVFVRKLREVYKCDDDVIIYTGCYPFEPMGLKGADALTEFKNIIIKWGRYRPNCPIVYDEVLGVLLSSDNQFAERIS